MGPSGSVIAPGRERQQQSAVSESVERFVGRGKLGQAVFARLDRAEIKMTPGEFVTLWLAILMGSLAVGLLLKGFIGLLVLGVAGGLAPWIYLTRRISRRQKKFVEQLADMAQMMGNSMRAGFSITQSLELVANEGAPPISEEFRRVVTEIKLGLSLETALDHMKNRMPSEDLELLVVAISVQRQIGGNLSEILMVISQTIRERVRFARDLRTLTAQARISSWIITALPVCVAIAINILDAPYESFLYKNVIGNFMIGAALVMLALGFFFLSRIANIEV
jgi:tight adherence protein B